MTFVQEICVPDEVLVSTADVSVTRVQGMWHRVITAKLLITVNSQILLWFHRTSAVILGIVHRMMQLGRIAFVMKVTEVIVLVKLQMLCTTKLVKLWTLVPVWTVVTDPVTTPRVAKCISALAILDILEQIAMSLICV